AGDGGGAEVVQVGQFRLVANWDPRTLENVLKLVLENPRIGIDAAINPLTRLERRIRQPLLLVYGSLCAVGVQAGGHPAEDLWFFAGISFLQSCAHIGGAKITS